jgi:serine/threonine protein kinase
MRQLAAEPTTPPVTDPARTELHQPAADGDDSRYWSLLDRWQTARRAGLKLTAAELCPDDPALQARLAEDIEKLERIPQIDLSGPPLPDTAVPDRIPGYTNLRELARGGMGVVLAAREEALGRDVAIKLPLAKAARGPLLDRFREESRITARLPHPGIPPVYTLGELADGRPFLVMKLVEGDTLSDRLKARATPGHDWADWSRVVTDLCRTVGHAHHAGVVHRDLKPGNVMVGRFGEVQVMDWGLAKVLADGPAVGGPGLPVSGDLTAYGAILGTPAYMAPEQARGEPVDARADVFALGAILFHVLTGAGPYGRGSALDLVMKAAAGDLADAHAKLASWKGADPELCELTRRCLAVRAADRPADANELAVALAAHEAERADRARRKLLTEAESDASTIRTTAKQEGEANWGFAYWGGGIALAVVIGLVKFGLKEAGRPAPAPSNYSQFTPVPGGITDTVFREQAERRQAEAQAKRRAGDLDVPPVDQIDAERHPAPTTAALERRRGQKALDEQKADDAVAHFHRAVRADPTHPDGLDGLAQALLAAGKPELAAGYAHKAVEAGKNGPAFRRTLGQAQLAAGDRADGLATLQAVILDNPKDVDARQALAEEYAAVGDWAEASDAAMLAFGANRAEAARAGRPLRYRMAVWSAKAAVAADGGPAGRPAARHRQRAQSVLAVELKEGGRLPTDRFVAARSDWLAEPAFAPFRSAEGLAALPQAERVKWQEFWAEVSKLSGVPNPADQ